MYSNVKSTDLPLGLVYNSLVGFMEASVVVVYLLCASATWF